MCEELNEELDRGDKLALELVDHLDSMGAASCVLAVEDRAIEYVVIVMPKKQYDERKWPI
jgi:hypothetical protein